MMAAVLEGLEPEETAAAAEDAARSAVEAVESRLGAPFLLAGNQLNLDVHPGGCHRLQYLCSQQPPELLQVEFLRLSTHEDPRLLDDTLAQVPWSLLRLRSLVLKGEYPYSDPDSVLLCLCFLVHKGHLVPTLAPDLSSPCT